MDQDPGRPGDAAGLHLRQGSSPRYIHVRLFLLSPQPHPRTLDQSPPLPYPPLFPPGWPAISSSHMSCRPSQGFPHILCQWGRRMAPPAATVAARAAQDDPRAAVNFGERVPYVVVHGPPSASHALVLSFRFVNCWNMPLVFTWRNFLFLAIRNIHPKSLSRILLTLFCRRPTHGCLL